MFGEPGAWAPSDDILRNTREGIETLVRLGEEIALAPASTRGQSRVGPSFVHL